MTAAALPATDEQRAVLKRMASSTSLPHRQVVQARRGWCWHVPGLANEDVLPAAVRRTRKTARRWRLRFAEQGPAGVGKITKVVGASRACPRARSARCCG